MIFHQMFETLSSTYTYLLGCEDTGQAILIDPVVTTMDRDLAEIARRGLRLVATLDTHVHADHITGALHLKQRIGSRIAAPAMDGLPCVDLPVEEGKPVQWGSIRLDPLHTPGHTDTHHCYRLADRIFTGDCLLIDGCGRTDFQNGSTDALYRSVTQKLFTLPEDTLVYPGHDYQNRRVSSIAQERRRNPRLGANRSLEEFRRIMSELKLSFPTFIEYAVPGNRKCGECPSGLPEDLEKYCRQMTESPQG